MSKFLTYFLAFSVTVGMAFVIQNNTEPLFRDHSDVEQVDEVLVVGEIVVDKTETKEETSLSSKSIPTKKVENNEESSQEVVGASKDTAVEENATVPKTTGECQTQIDESFFYWESEMQAVKIEEELRESLNSEDADLLRGISCVPQAVWIFGDNEENASKKLKGAITKSALDGKTPVFVIYNAPQHSALNWGTGVGNGNAYLMWIKTIADEIGDANAWVILEPDAIPLSHNLTPQSRAVRLAEIRGAVEILKERAPNIRVYLDAGHNLWKIPERISEYLTTAGIKQADGFSLNVSNYQSISDEIKYGKKISKLTGGKHFVIDTSRNGNGSKSGYDWCNALGRAIGKTPTIETNDPLVDAFLWIKLPGESDGSCNGGPTPGKFWLDYALDLIKEAL